ncbi:hypothetical protein PMIN01_10942 [Paraphaeosphaeria minitans]|uniref:Uncharacterized protein n=1 Tax=Paraphaeosphaeria minitans TaxID=565426 RepID=A0A9P6GB46_9PLEO|nr:hypothetical protein PMIN01_10942 [Paraphaeosphaeria minitans]
MRMRGCLVTASLPPRPLRRHNEPHLHLVVPNGGCQRGPSGKFGPRPTTHDRTAQPSRRRRRNVNLTRRGKGGTNKETKREKTRRGKRGKRRLCSAAVIATRRAHACHGRFGMALASSWPWPRPWPSCSFPRRCPRTQNAGATDSGPVEALAQDCRTGLGARRFGGGEGAWEDGRMDCRDGPSGANFFLFPLGRARGTQGALDYLDRFRRSGEAEHLAWRAGRVLREMLRGVAATEGHGLGAAGESRWRRVCVAGLGWARLGWSLRCDIRVRYARRWAIWIAHAQRAHVASQGSAPLESSLVGQVGRALCKVGKALVWQHLARRRPTVLPVPCHFPCRTRDGEEDYAESSPLHEDGAPYMSSCANGTLSTLRALRTCPWSSLTLPSLAVGSLPGENSDTDRTFPWGGIATRGSVSASWLHVVHVHTPMGRAYRKEGQRHVVHVHTYLHPSEGHGCGEDESLGGIPYHTVPYHTYNTRSLDQRGTKAA